MNKNWVGYVIKTFEARFRTNQVYIQVNFFNIVLYYKYLHLKKANRSEILE